MSVGAPSLPCRYSLELSVKVAATNGKREDILLLSGPPILISAAARPPSPAVLSRCSNNSTTPVLPILPRYFEAHGLARSLIGSGLLAFPFGRQILV